MSLRDPQISQGSRESKQYKRWKQNYVKQNFSRSTAGFSLLPYYKVFFDDTGTFSSSSPGLFSFHATLKQWRRFFKTVWNKLLIFKNTYYYCLCWESHHFLYQPTNPKNEHSIYVSERRVNRTFILPIRRLKKPVLEVACYYLHLQTIIPCPFIHQVHKTVV